MRNPQLPNDALALARSRLTKAVHHLERAAAGMEEPERGAVEAAAEQIGRVIVRVRNAARLAAGIR